MTALHRLRSMMPRRARIMGWALPWTLALATFGAFLAFAEGPGVRRGDLVVSHVADLPADPSLRIGGAPASLGYLHREYSLLDMPLWIEDERGFVLYRQDGTRRLYTEFTAAHRAALTAQGWHMPAPLGFLERWSGLLLTGLVLALATVAAAVPAQPRRAFA